MGLSQIRLKAERLTVGFFRLGQLPLQPKGFTQVYVSPPVLRLACNRLLEDFHRLGMLPLLLQDRAQVEIIVGVNERERRHLAESGFRLG